MFGVDFANKHHPQKSEWVSMRQSSTVSDSRFVLFTRTGQDTMGKRRCICHNNSGQLPTIQFPNITSDN